MRLFTFKFIRSLSVRCLLAALVASGPFARAQPTAKGPVINVGGLYDYLPGGTSSIMKPIRNDGDETGFVIVEIKRITFDANGRLKEVPQSTEGALEDRLIVSPNRLIVPPQGARSVRILYVGKRATEQYFRVRYLPVQPSQKTGFDVSSDVEQKYARAGLKVLIGYGELVFVRPTSERYQTQITDASDALTIANHGNSTIILDDYRETKSKDDASDEPSRKFILPGRTLTVKKFGIQAVVFDLVEGAGVAHKQFEFSR